MSQIRRLIPLVSSLVLTLSAYAAEDQFASYRNLAPANGYAVQNFSFMIGHLRIEVASGSLFPLTSGSEIYGWLIDGQAKYIYSTDDPTDKQVLAKNIENSANGVAHTDRTVYDDFGRGFILAVKPVIDEKSLGSPAVTVSSSIAGYFQERQAKFLEELGGFDHAAALIQLNKLESQFAYGEIEGARSNTVRYRYDGLFSDREHLGTLVQWPGFKWRAVRQISSQMLAGTQRKRPASYLVSHLGLIVDTRDNRSGTIESSLDLEVLEPNQRVLVFDLLNNRDHANSSNWTSTKNQLKVDSVSDAGGAALAFSHRYNTLLVDLGSAPAVGTKLSFRVHSSGEVFLDSGDTHNQNFVMLLGGWYPDAEGHGLMNFTLDLTARCKKPWTILASGDTLSSEEQGEQTVLVGGSKVPLREVALFMGRYTPYSMTNELGTKIKFHGYGDVRVEGLEELAKMTGVFAKMFSDMLGPIPFGEVELVEMPQYSPWGYYGISPPGVILVSDTLTKTVNLEDLSKSGNYDYYKSRQAPSLIAHELAHQWFPHVAAPASLYDYWLSESIAELQAGIALQYAHVDQMGAARGKPIKGWQALREDWASKADWCQNYSIESAATYSGENAGEIYRCLLYRRGPLVLQMLRSWIGDKGYFELLRRVLKAHRFDLITTDDFEAETQKLLGGQNMRWFFDDWIRTPETPVLHVDAKLEDRSGRPTLVCKANFRADGPTKRLYVPIVLTMPGGQKLVKMFFIDKPDALQAIPLDVSPSQIEVDPEKNSLVKWY